MPAWLARLVMDRSRRWKGYSRRMRSTWGSASTATSSAEPPKTATSAITKGARGTIQMSEGLSRRSFLKLAATAGAAAAIPGCEPAARKIIPYVVPDENVIPGVPTFYATTCNECPAGCGIIAKVREGRVIKLEGNPADPISQGAICARGQAALQGLYNPDRLAKPMLRADDGSLREISWDDATKELNSRLKVAAR